MSVDSVGQEKSSNVSSGQKARTSSSRISPSQCAPRLGNVMQMTKGAPSDLFNM